MTSLWVYLKQHNLPSFLKFADNITCSLEAENFPHDFPLPAFNIGYRIPNPSELTGLIFDVWDIIKVRVWY